MLRLAPFMSAQSHQTIYRYNCWLADKEQIAVHEGYMGSVIAREIVGSLLRL
jgi:hypothetical protein